MTFMDPNDPTRVPNDNSARPVSRVPDRNGMAVWGFPLIVIVALVILGFVFFGTHESSTTASNTPATTSGQSTTAPSPQTSGQATPSPAPATPPAPKQ